jgi:hypothetical protein
VSHGLNIKVPQKYTTKFLLNPFASKELTKKMTNFIVLSSSYIFSCSRDFLLLLNLIVFISTPKLPSLMIFSHKLELISCFSLHIACNYQPIFLYWARLLIGYLNANFIGSRAALYHCNFWIVYKSLELHARWWNFYRPCVWLLITLSRHNEISERWRVWCQKPHHYCLSEGSRQVGCDAECCWSITFGLNTDLSYLKSI